MKIFITFLLTFTIAITTEIAFADDLLNEINRLIRFINIQTNQNKIVSLSRYSSNIHSVIRKAAKRYRLDPLFIEAMIKVESNYNLHAVSNKGAMGLMQLMPGTAREIGVTKPFDPYQNIMAGTYYYRLMLERYGNHRKALYAYNCGPECVDNGKIPRESRLYANNVIHEYKNLKRKERRYVK